MADIEVETEVTGNVWKVLCQVGDHVETEQELVILESMKMEFEVRSPTTGVLTKTFAKVGDQVTAGFVLFEVSDST